MNLIKIKNKHLNFNSIVILVPYIIISILEINSSIPFESPINFMEKINITYIILPLAIFIFSIFFSKKESIKKKYGNSLYKRLILNNSNFNISINDILLYIFSAIFISMFSTNYLCLYFIIHTIVIIFKIYNLFSNFYFNDILINEIKQIENEIVKNIDKHELDFKDLKYLIRISFKSIDSQDTYIFENSLKSINIILNKILKNKNLIIDKEKEKKHNNIETIKNEINNKIQKNYNNIIVLINNAMSNDVIFDKNKYLYLLVETLTNCYYYDEVKIYKNLSNVLLSRYAYKDFISNANITNTFIIQIYDITYDEIMDSIKKNSEKDKLDDVWENVILESLGQIIIFISMSSNTNIYNSFIRMITNLLDSDCLTIDTYRKIASILFHTSKLSVSNSNTETHFFSHSLRHHYAKVSKQSEKAKIFIDEFFFFLNACFNANLENTYLENYIFLEYLINDTDNKDIHEYLMLKLRNQIFEDFNYNSFEKINFKYIQIYLNRSNDNESLHQDYYKLINYSIQNSSSLFSFVINEYSKGLINLEKHEKKLQIEYIENFRKFIYKVSNNNSDILFNILLNSIINTFTTMNNDKKISNSLSKEILNFYKKTITDLVENEKNEYALLLIDTLYSDILLLNLENISEGILKILEDVAIRSIEYNNIIVLKSVSNTIGWLTQKKALLEYNSDLLDESLNIYSNIIELSMISKEDKNTLIYLCTAFIILGSFSQQYKEEENQKYKILRDKIISKMLDIEKNYQSGIMYTAKKFRTTYSIHDKKNKLNNKYIEEFYKCFNEKKINIANTESAN